ncbi:MAG: GntR family transcriptional regulator [Planctomycetota bacterium]
MNIEINTNSPVPLYHQIAEAISYRIATGRLMPGDGLPSVRDLAARLNVNMHTVRRAYQVLSEQGLVESRAPSGTKVTGKPSSAAKEGPGAAERFLSRVLKEASERFGYTPRDLALRIMNLPASGAGNRPVLHVVECSESECLDHAREIEAVWDVEARPWSLSNEGEVPAGPVVATYFHYNDIRRRWPHRLDEIRFVSIRPDPGLAARIGPVPRRGRKAVILCEFEEQKAINIAADLESVLPRARYSLKPLVVKKASEALDAKAGRTPVVLTPRIWAQLKPDEQTRPGLFKVFYTITPQDLAALGEQAGWKRRRP